MKKKKTNILQLFPDHVAEHCVHSISLDVAAQNRRRNEMADFLACHIEGDQRS